MKSEVIIYKGIRFYRYPNSKTLAARYYFRPSIRDIQNGYDSLHRELWKDWFGKIPKGYVIHHKDENPLNNKLRNFELKKIGSHSSEHNIKKWSKKSKADKKKLLLKTWIGNKKWHKTKEAHEHHKLIQKLSIASYKARKREFSCVFCNELFITKSNATLVKYCSWGCNYRHLRILRGLPVRKHKWQKTKKRLETR